MAKNFFEKIAKLILTEGVKEVIKRVKQGDKEKKNPPPTTEPSNSSQTEEKTHPWRTCPIGQHWRRPHPMKVPLSEKNPTGVRIRTTGCCNNPQRKNKNTIKDAIHPEEIHQIAQNYFDKLTGPPTSGKLKKYKDADKYDSFIRGWTHYWNEVFQPDDTLDPDLVKALIASESGFDLHPKEVSAGKAGTAHGLIQLTDEAIKVLSDPHGELGDHLVLIKKSDIIDPNISICAGIRWLFQKRKLASNLLGRPATWEEAIANYKGYLREILSGKNKNPTGMENLKDRLKELKE